MNTFVITKSDLLISIFNSPSPSVGKLAWNQRYCFIFKSIIQGSVIHNGSVKETKMTIYRVCVSQLFIAGTKYLTQMRRVYFGPWIQRTQSMMCWFPAETSWRKGLTEERFSLTVARKQNGREETLEKVLGVFTATVIYVDISRSVLHGSPRHFQASHTDGSNQSPQRAKGKCP